VLPFYIIHSQTDFKRKERDMVFLGIILTVSGIGSIIYGVNQNNSLEAQFNSVFGSGSTDPGTIFIILGVIGVMAGLIIMYVGYKKDATTPVSGNTKKCPFCANVIKHEAIVCQFCGREVPVPKVENFPSGKTPIQYSGKEYSIITPTKIFYERDTNSNVVKNLDIGDKVFHQYEVKEGQIMWYFIKAFGSEGWCKAEFLKEC